jgi:predicted dehydrogenase
MIAGERDRPDGAQLVSIVTPNHLHLPVAIAALEAGLAVMSDKPATATLAEARQLAEVVARTGGLYALSYTYLGYPLVREMRERVAAGALGEIRKVSVEYLQGWLSERIEDTGHKQAAWRADPARSGPGGCTGDIGVHALNLAEFVTGLKVARLSADVSAIVPGRRLDDDCSALLRFDNGARGVLQASQVAAGERNGLRLRVYGEKGGLDWRQEEPDRLTIRWLHGPVEILYGGGEYLSPAATAASRLPGGHPEGYVEAFANIYRDFAAQLRARLAGEPPPPASALQSIAAGIRGMAFIEAVIASSNGAGWIEFAP